MILQGIVISTNVVTLKLQDLARLQTISSSPLSSLFPQGVADVHGQSDQADSLIFDSRVELKSLMRTGRCRTERADWWRCGRRVFLSEAAGRHGELDVMRTDVSGLFFPPLSHPLVRIKGCN